MSCRRFRVLVAEAALAPPEGSLAPELVRHLEGCPGCVAELTALRHVAGLVDAARPASRLAQDAWNRLVPALDAIDAERDRALLPRWLSLRPATLAMAAAALAVAAGLALLLARPPTVPQAAATARSMVADPLDEQLDRYLRRSTPLLLALSNRDGDASAEAFDAVAERRLARELAREGRELAGELRLARSGREGALVNNLVVVFMQVGNTPGERYRSRVALARDTIERHGLLFELSLRELRRAGVGVETGGAPA